MAKGKYERKIINTHISQFQDQLERSYSKYQQGSYVIITYYQLDKGKTKLDSNLDVAQNIIGGMTSRQYKKILEVPMYGLVSGINYELELTDTSFKSLTAGSAYFTPGTITPSADDFFVINRPGMRNHLFKVTSLDFNTAGSNKYYQFNFELHQNSVSDIELNVSGEYQFLIENMGSNQNTIIRTADAMLMEEAKHTVDVLIDKYILAFYDYGYDTFTLRIDNPANSNTKLWNPYVIRFLHDYNIINKYNYDLMTEIYVPQYIEGQYEHWFKDDIWAESLYNKIANRLPLETLDLFTTVDVSTSLTKWIKLPFYQSSETILLDSLANNYYKNYINIPREAFGSLPDINKGNIINLRSMFDSEIHIGQRDEPRYINDKYLYELEYFSENAADILFGSKLGDIYYVYNNNSGNIDNVYRINNIPGELAPGEEDDLLKDSEHYKLLENYQEEMRMGASLFFVSNQGEVTSAWQKLSDGENVFIGRLDGNIFSSKRNQIANDMINTIKGYYNNHSYLNKDMLVELRNMIIRRDNVEYYYLLPLLIFVLKDYIDRIQI